MLRVLNHILRVQNRMEGESFERQGGREVSTPNTKGFGMHAKASYNVVVVVVVVVDG